MKIREGFVSNSSTTSFLVGFSEVPTVEKLRRILFGQRKVIPFIYSSGVCNPQVLAEIIHEDLVNQKPLSKDEFIEEIMRGWDAPMNLPKVWFHKYGFPSFRHYEYDDETGTSKDRYDEFKKTLYKAATKFYEDQIEAKRLKYYVFEFGNDMCAPISSEVSATLEHGEIFRNLVCWEIDHH